MNTHAQSGMTLIEVLVALAILGLIAGSVLTMTGQSARFVAVSEERMLARIAADNQIIEILAQQQPMEEGVEIKQTEFARRAWDIEQTVTKTGVNGVYRIDIRVALADQRQTLAKTTTLKASSQ